MADKAAPKQLLHIVIGGELARLDSHEFKDLSKVDIVGLYPNYAAAYAVWKAKAQQTVDNAEMRYFIVHLHRLLDPESSSPRAARRRRRGRGTAVGKAADERALVPTNRGRCRCRISAAGVEHQSLSARAGRCL